MRGERIKTRTLMIGSALFLALAGLAASFLPELLAVAVPYAVLAGWFGIVLFGDPLATSSAASGSARPGSGRRRT